VGKNNPEQGKGFYTLCEELGLGSVGKLKKNLFGILEMKRCHDFWGEDANYLRYS
jgi:hypothetical protein